MKDQQSGQDLHLNALIPPWGDHPSIYQFILDNKKADGRVASYLSLPDEAPVRDDNEYHLAPGALEGIFLHMDDLGLSGADDFQKPPASVEKTEPHDQKILSALRQVIIEPTNESAVLLYNLLLQQHALAYITPLMGAIEKSSDPPSRRVVEVGYWLATEAADREAVKAGMAFLSLCRSSAYRDLFLILGSHEEFTMYAAESLRHSETESDRLIWELAKSVGGWGRVSLVEKLASTTDPDIKRWMLVKGFRNNVECHKVVFVCAQTGDLYTALLDPKPDDEILEGAGDILDLLMYSHGRYLITEYANAAETTLLYLRHLQTREVSNDAFSNVKSIARFLRKDYDGIISSNPEWNNRKDEMLALITSIYAQPVWKKRVLEWLASDDDWLFGRAVKMAAAIGFDIWESCFTFLQQTGDWSYITLSLNEERLERLLAYAGEILLLDQFPSGQEEADKKVSSALSSLFDALWHFTGKGCPFILAGLRSPSDLNRTNAAFVLAIWPRHDWPEEMEATLRFALTHEEDPDVKEIMKKTLSGDEAIRSHAIYRLSFHDKFFEY